MKTELSKIKWLTQTSLLLALLITLQWLTKPLGQLVTGSCVNGVLAVSALMVNSFSGICIGILSPFLAFFLGIGPVFFPLTPIICVGNCLYVLVLSWLYGRKSPTLTKSVISVGVSALCKAGALYLLVVQGVCRLAELKPQQVKTFTMMFSWPQLFSALIGGAMAAALVPILNKILKKR